MSKEDSIEVTGTVLEKFPSGLFSVQLEHERVVLARQVCQNHALVFQLYAEKSARELLQHRTGYFNAVLFTHKPPKVRWAGRRRHLPVPAPARGSELSRCDLGSL